MLQSSRRPSFESKMELPAHFDEAVQTAEDLLNAPQLALTAGEATITRDRDALRLYLERPGEHPLHPEKVALHLGKQGTWLMVSIAGMDTTTLTLQNGKADLYHRTASRIFPAENITENETAGRHFTNRLYESLGAFGLYGAEQLAALQKAS